MKRVVDVDGARQLLVILNGEDVDLTRVRNDLENEPFEDREGRVVAMARFDELFGGDVLQTN